MDFFLLAATHVKWAALGGWQVERLCGDCDKQYWTAVCY